MWIVSLVAHLESRSKFRKLIKDAEKRAGKLEEERASLLAALKQGAEMREAFHQPQSVSPLRPVPAPEEERHPAGTQEGESASL
jgi:hypothetical protein